ncbi:LysR family substrate-binding domain-containing protein [Paramicrobacterium chengjingii]|uniref:LysR family substrate-binding domain-containing protein n=1 Tax=Paramicrobacterium chengjingii TaxID=2769067 RepID=A0ABX6YKW7_9MICO|nr:LysR family substrate-binding domain-containing protein [Microbacterium chengjingii]QPZ38985.1 LysR family substrate-binding domain-containing protein [Microbacterium chengjingii]
MGENTTDAVDGRRLRVAFVPGVTPDKWFRTWRERLPDVGIAAVPLEDELEQRLVLTDGRADMSLVRLPIDDEGLHVIPLYTENPVVVAPKGHQISAVDAVDIAELADEHLLQHPDAVPEWRDVAREVADGTRIDVPPMTPRVAIELVGAGAGIVIVPLSVARQFDRKDVIRRPVSGVAETRVALCWPADAEGELIEQFIGVVRGRSARSTRSQGSVKAEQEAAKQRAAKKKDAARRSAEQARERKNADRAARRKAGGRKRGRR